MGFLGAYFSVNLMHPIFKSNMYLRVEKQLISGLIRSINQDDVEYFEVSKEMLRQSNESLKNIEQGIKSFNK